MPIRRKSVLLEIQWWIYIILAIIVYMASKSLLPAIFEDNVLAAGTIPVSTRMISGSLLVLAALSAYNSRRKAGLIDRQKGIETLRALNWKEFEELVGEAFRRKGYAVAETGIAGADGGVDLILKKGGEHLLVQCKHWRMQKVGVKVVRELYGVIAAEGTTGGMVISSGTFTQEAQAFAQGKPLELLGGPALLNLVADVQKKSTNPEARPDQNVCPLCGSEMVLRTAKKGPQVGVQFWGCTKFPQCRGTKPYQSR